MERNLEEPILACMISYLGKFWSDADIFSLLQVKKRGKAVILVDTLYIDRQLSVLSVNNIVTMSICFMLPLSSCCMLHVSHFLLLYVKCLPCPLLTSAHPIPDTSIHNSLFTIYNLYGPNKDDPSFFPTLPSTQKPPQFIGGDLQSVLELLIDRWSIAGMEELGNPQ